MTVGSIDYVLTCRHTPDDNCDCRKPKTGMFHRAQRVQDLDLKASYMIGDTDTDIKAARSIGAYPILVTTGRGRDYEFAAKAMRVTVAPDVYAAAEFIIERERSLGSHHVRQQDEVTQFLQEWGR